MTDITELKQRANTAAFAERRWGMQFKQDGQGRRKALCPLHHETEASFVVYPDGGWRCFGSCNRGGDILDLVMLKDNIDFATALQEVARFCGVTLTPLTPQARLAAQTRRETEETLALARAHFEARLKATPQAMDYCRWRGWDEKTIEAHHLGYNDGTVREALRKAGMDLNSKGAQAALSIPIGMLVYPHIEFGRTVYLSGRLADREQKGHYNPPTKLIGARQPFWNAVQGEDVVVIEGQADAVTLGGWGISAAALAGCGLTAQAGQDLVKRLRRAHTVYIWPDGDGNTDVAGLAQAIGPMTRIVSPPEDVSDANAWLQQGATAKDALELLAGARRWLDLLIEEASRTKAEEAMQAAVKAFSSLDIWGQAAWRKRLCTSMDLTVDELKRMVKAVEEHDEEGPLQQDEYMVRQGMFCRVVLNESGVYHRALSNFTASIIEDIVEDDGEEKLRRFTVEGKLFDGTVLPKVEVEAGQFVQMQWLTQLWGARATVAAGSSSRDHLRACIQMLSREVAQRHEFSHLGWREIGGKQVYLTSAGAIGLEGVQVHIIQDLARYRLPLQPENEQAAMRASLQFLNTGNHEVTVPLWAAIYLAPLTGILPPSFTLWFYGTTGSLKSTATALAMCHYGRFAYNTPPASWTATANALEKMAFLAKDAPLWIDDYTGQATMRGMDEIRRRANRLLRDWGNRSGRSRMQSNLQFRRTFVPRGLIISTAELLPPGQSILARLFAVPVHPEDMTRGEGSALTVAQLADSKLYPQAMAGYLLWLEAQWQSLETSLREKHLRYTEAARSEGEHLRMPSHVATMFIGYEMGIEYALAVEAVEEGEAQELLGLGWEILVGIGEEQHQVVAEEKPVDMFFDALDQMMSVGTIYLAHKDWPEDGEKVQPKNKHLNAEFIGWYDEHFLYLISKVAYNAVTQFYRAGNQLFPDTERGVRVKLKEESLLLPHGDRFSYQVRIGDRRHRVLRIHRSEKFDLINPSGDNGDNGDSGDNQRQELLL